MILTPVSDKPTITPGDFLKAAEDGYNFEECFAAGLPETLSVPTQILLTQWLPQYARSPRTDKSQVLKNGYLRFYACLLDNIYNLSAAELENFQRNTPGTVGGEKRRKMEEELSLYSLEDIRVLSKIYRKSETTEDTDLSEFESLGGEKGG